MLSLFSPVQLFLTLWTVVHQNPLSVRFSRQEYWNGLPCPPSWDLPNPGIEPASLMSPALADEFFITSAIWEAHRRHMTPLKSQSPHFEKESVNKNNDFKVFGGKMKY